MKNTFSIRPVDCKFIINEQNHKVICILEHTNDLFLNFIKHHSHFPLEWDCVGNLLLTKKLRMPDRFVAVATCSKDDEWNEELGRKIAFMRLKYKVNKSFFKRANTYISTLDRWLDDIAIIFNELGAKLEDNHQHMHEHIDKLLNVEQKL